MRTQRRLRTSSELGPYLVETMQEPAGAAFPMGDALLALPLADGRLRLAVADGIEPSPPARSVFGAGVAYGSHLALAALGGGESLVEALIAADRELFQRPGVPLGTDRGPTSALAALDLHPDGSLVVVQACDALVLVRGAEGWFRPYPSARAAWALRRSLELADEAKTDPVRPRLEEVRLWARIEAWNLPPVGRFGTATFETLALEAGEWDAIALATAGTGTPKLSEVDAYLAALLEPECRIDHPERGVAAHPDRSLILVTKSGARR